MDAYKPGKKKYKSYTIVDWLHEPLEPGATSLNAPYLRTFKTIRSEFGRNNMIAYFLVTRLNIYDCRTLLRSGTKQKALVNAICGHLKSYPVLPEYKKDFDVSIARLFERCRYVFMILKDNIRVTPYHVYFETVGYDKLLDYAFNKYDAEIDDAYLKEIEDFNAQHEEEIAQHMKSVQAEIEARDRHREEVKQAREAEKEAAKRLRQAEQNEIKTMKQYEKEYKKRERALGKYFKGYYG